MVPGVRLLDSAVDLVSRNEQYDTSFKDHRIATLFSCLCLVELEGDPVLGQEGFRQSMSCVHATSAHMQACRVPLRLAD